MRWDAARGASKRPLRKYKPVGPAHPGSGGVTHDMVMRTPSPLLCVADIAACEGCGYHVCSCERQEFVRPPYGKTDEGVEIEHFAYMKPGGDSAWYSRDVNKVFVGLITQKQLDALRKFKVPCQHNVRLENFG